MLDKTEIISLIEFAEKLAKNSGSTLLKLQKKVRIVKLKKNKDITTNSDLISENLIIEKISKKYQEHSIYSEENGLIDKKSDFLWIIDPLDGTKEYLKRIPIWNVSIALEYKKELILSVIYHPIDDSLYKSVKGMGCFLNDKKIKVSKTRYLEDSFIYCYLPNYQKEKGSYDFAFEKLKDIGKKVYRLRSLSNENTALCWLALGSIDAYINLGNPPKWHDIAPGLLIAKEAGAQISDIYGKKINKKSPKNLLIASNKNIQKSLIEVIKK